MYRMEPVFSCLSLSFWLEFELCEWDRNDHLLNSSQNSFRSVKLNPFDSRLLTCVQGGSPPQLHFCQECSRTTTMRANAPDHDKECAKLMRSGVFFRPFLLPHPSSRRSCVRSGARRANLLQCFQRHTQQQRGDMFCLHCASFILAKTKVRRRAVIWRPVCWALSPGRRGC